MPLPAVLESLRLHPAMHATKGLDATVSFIVGYASALPNFLVGFREWLIVEFDGGANLAWPALVNELYSQSTERGGVKADEEKAVAFVFTTLERFLTDRSEDQGLRRIFLSYEAWLSRQRWYDESSPVWLDGCRQLRNGRKKPPTRRITRKRG